MDVIRSISDYIKEIAKINAGGDATEHSYRTAIQKMLQAASDKFGTDLEVLQESPRGKFGAPDFRVSAKGGGIIGYIECKKPGANLQKLTISAQLQKYHALSDNILLTDSWRWWLLRKGKKIKDIALTKNPTAQTKKDFSKMLYIFIEAEAEKITSTERLAETLARRCAILREGLEAHESDDPAQSRLHGLLKEFRTALDTELSFAQFADTFAQTVVYSSLLAKLKAPASTTLSLRDINHHIPTNFALILDITVFLQDLRKKQYKDIAWVVKDVLAAVNAMDVVAVTESMS